MSARGVSAVYVGEAGHQTVTEICEGEYQIKYLSPESLLTNATWQDMLQGDIYPWLHLLWMRLTVLQSGKSSLDFSLNYEPTCIVP